MASQLCVAHGEGRARHLFSFPMIHGMDTMQCAKKAEAGGNKLRCRHDRSDAQSSARAITGPYDSDID